MLDARLKISSKCLSHKDYKIINIKYGFVLNYGISKALACRTVSDFTRKFDRIPTVKHDVVNSFACH